MSRAGSTAGPNLPRGNLDRADPDGLVAGWCWAPDDPTGRRTVEVLVDGEPALQLVADLPRPDLLGLAIGDGRHGFRGIVPPDARAGGVLAGVEAVDVATGRRIGGILEVVWAEDEQADPAPPPNGLLVPASPATPDVPAAPLSGNVDVLTADGWLAGWCWDAAATDRRVTLQVRIDGETVGEVVAREPRPDLAQAGLGDGRHGFAFVIPHEALADRAQVRVSLTERNTDRPLGLPMTLLLGGLTAEERRLLALERRVDQLAGRSEQSTLSVAEMEAPGLEERIVRQIAARMAVALSGRDPIVAALDSLELGLAALRLRTPAHPATTILVPGTAPAEQIHACLAALHEVGSDAVAHVVLVAPAAADPRGAWLPALIGQVRTGGPTRDLGQALAHAAAEATTRFVAVVSPWVSVRPGWLLSLAGTLATEPATAMVGAAVARHDGLPGHGGIDLRRDGIVAERLIRSEREPEWRFMRPVSALAARCVLIERAAMVRVGGIDAEYGDPDAALIDLSLRLRSAGSRVLIQPQARVIAASGMAGATIGLADGARLRRSIDSASHHARDAEGSFVGHALFVDERLPDISRDAGSVATFEQMQLLRRLGWRVTFAAATGATPEARTAMLIGKLEQSGIEVADPEWFASVNAYLRGHGRDLGLVVLVRYRVAEMLLPAVRALAPQARVIFAPADLHHVRLSRAAALGLASVDEAETARQTELGCIRDADATLLLSDHERAQLTTEPDIPPRRLHVLRWVARPLLNIPNATGRDALVFIGHFRHEPNVDAVLWYAEAIKPLLPGLVLDVIGADPPPAIRTLDGAGIRVHGWVEDLTPLFGRARASVAPLRYGAGFKGKVATSLAHGVPVVGTSIAFEGTGLQPGDGIASADDAGGLAEAVLRMFGDDVGWTALSARARERVSALYAPEHGARVLAGMLSELGLSVRPVGVT